MELVAGARGAAAIGSDGTTIGDGAEADGAEVVTSAAGTRVDGLAAGARGIAASAAGEFAVSAGVRCRGAAFELATGGDDFVAAALADAAGRAGVAASRDGSVSTRANDGGVPTGELIAGVAGVAGGGAAGVRSARGAVTGAAGAALPLSERDGPKNT